MTGAHLMYGFICDTKPASGLVRVQFGEDSTNEDNKVLVSDWIPVSVRKSLSDKETFPYDVNEHVWCVMEDEDCQNGVVGGAIYNDTDLPDGAGADIYRVLYKDGSFEQFSRSTGEFQVNVKGDLKLDTPSGKKVIINGGGNGPLIIIQYLVNKINRIENDNNAFKNAIQSALTTVVTEPGNGAPSALQVALNAALTTYYSDHITNTTVNDIKNDRVQH